jgi:hypothetical protein
MPNPNTWPYNKERGCPAGYVETAQYNALGRKRKTICTKKGRAVVAIEKNRRNNVSKTRKKRGAFYIPSMHSLAKEACPPGEIQRKGFKRKYSSAVREKGYEVRRTSGQTYRVRPGRNEVYVAPSCVKLTGKSQPGVPSRVAPGRKGDLSQFGYSFNRDRNTRRRALGKAVTKYGPLAVHRKLRVMSSKLGEKFKNLHRRFGSRGNPLIHKIPEIAETFVENAEWIKKTYPDP